MSDRAALPHPASPDAPKYWRHEVTGRLEGPIMRYLENEPLSSDDAMLIRLYIQQWIDSPAWDQNPSMDAGTRAKLRSLRATARAIQTRVQIDLWLTDALDLGIDPL